MIRLRTLAGGTWRADAFPGATGAGVRVAVIDSGADDATMRGGPSRTQSRAQPTSLKPSAGMPCSLP